MKLIVYVDNEKNQFKNICCYLLVAYNIFRRIFRCDRALLFVNYVQLFSFQGRFITLMSDCVCMVQVQYTVNKQYLFTFLLYKYDVYFMSSVC